MRGFFYFLKLGFLLHFNLFLLFGIAIAIEGQTFILTASQSVCQVRFVRLKRD